MHICTINHIGQIVFSLNSLGLEIRVIIPIVQFSGNQICKCLDRTVSNMPMVGQLSDNVLSTCPIIGQCCVEQSNGQFMLCPTVRWLVILLSNSPMVRLCFFTRSNSWTVLCPTFQKLDNAVSNCPMVGQCCIQQSNGQSKKNILKMLLNFARFVGQFGIQNPIILTDLKIFCTPGYHIKCYLHLIILTFMGTLQVRTK